MVHAKSQARERGVSEEEVEDVIRQPDRVELRRRGRVVAQRRFPRADRTYLVRVVIDVDRDPPELVTVYRTSKIQKYEVEP